MKTNWLSRRNFLGLSIFGLPLFAMRTGFGQSRLKVKFPVVVSTWDSGLTANAAAWPILEKSGRALDAVEAAGRASEDEQSCCVGLGDYPEPRRHRYLDACIMDERANIGAVSPDRNQASRFRGAKSNGNDAARDALRRRRPSVRSRDGFPLESGSSRRIQKRMEKMA